MQIFANCSFSKKSNLILMISIGFLAGRLVIHPIEAEYPATWMAKAIRRRFFQKDFLLQLGE